MSSRFHQITQRTCPEVTSTSSGTTRTTIFRSQASFLSETVANMDPSPPHLRCKILGERLLRELQSSICVFYGANHRKEPPPEPTKFKNTLGYRWLLEFLNLVDRPERNVLQEMVEPIGEENASIKARSESKDEVPLSELLDLEIR